MNSENPDNPRDGARRPEAAKRGVADSTQQPAASAMHDAAQHFAEIREYVAFYIATKADGIKSTVRSVILYAVLGILALFAAAAAVSVSVALLLTGAAHGIGEALGERFWLGDLIIGVVIVGGLFLGLWIVMSSITKSSRKKTVEKYESRKRDQRLRYGHDIQRAGRG